METKYIKLKDAPKFCKLNEFDAAVCLSDYIDKCKDKRMSCMKVVKQIMKLKKPIVLKNQKDLGNQLNMYVEEITEKEYMDSLPWWKRWR